jgi:hypothetical protein
VSPAGAIPVRAAAIPIRGSDTTAGVTILGAGTGPAGPATKTLAVDLIQADKGALKNNLPNSTLARVWYHPIVPFAVKAVAADANFAELDIRYSFRLRIVILVEPSVNF